MEILAFATGALCFGTGIYIGFRLARLGTGEVPSLSLPSKVHGYFPSQKDMDDASDKQ